MFRFRLRCRAVVSDGVRYTQTFNLILIRHEATPEMWQETYLSALLRSVLYSDDPNYRLMGYRKLDPITTPEAEIRFLQTAEALFAKGSNNILLYTAVILRIPYRLAAGISARGSGRQHCIESSYSRYTQVLWRQLPI